MADISNNRLYISRLTKKFAKATEKDITGRRNCDLKNSDGRFDAQSIIIMLDDKVISALERRV